MNRVVERMDERTSVASRYMQNETKELEINGHYFIQMLQISLKRKHGLLLLLFRTFFSFFATVFLLLDFFFVLVVYFDCVFFLFVFILVLFAWLCSH